MPRSPLAPLVLLLACASCASTEANFTTRFASGFTPARHVVSVFGVYKDGQMSAEAWDSLAPQMSASLGAGKCEAGYVDPPRAKENAPLWTAVEEYARTNGPTDDLLAELAPAAQGDLVLVLTVAGRVPEETKVKVQDETPQKAMATGGRGGLGSMRNQGTMFRNPSAPAGAKEAFDLAALLYSVSEKKSVGQISLEYTGHNANEALAKFAAQLRQSLPAASCAGWTWGDKVDVERVRKLGE
jgi:hypothetical protein